MPRYHYRALTREGRTIKGEWIASNIDELEQRLFRSGLELINAKITNRSSFLWQDIAHLRDLMDFCFYLEQMIESDLPLLQGLREMRDALPSASLKNVVANISDSVENGKTLSEAIAVHSNFFGGFFAPLLAAGEKTGQMVKVVNYIYTYIEWRVDFYVKIKNMVTYPLISLMFICISFISIFIFVLPEMRRFFSGMQIEIPWYTRGLMAFSDFIMAYWGYLAVSVTLTVIVFAFSYLESSRFRLWLSHTLISLPLIGKFLMTISMVRFFHVMTLGISSGVPFLEAIELSIPVISNVYVSTKIKEIHSMIQIGGGISQSFSKAGIFESIIIQFFHVAERTGELERVLNQATRFYEYELKRRMELVETWLQPIMLSVVGGLLGWVMMSILGAIYQNLERLPI